MYEDLQEEQRMLWVQCWPCHHKLSPAQRNLNFAKHEGWDHLIAAARNPQPVTKDNKQNVTLNTGQKATIHQVTTMLATFKNVLFPGHNHLLTLAGTWAIVEVSGHQHRWLAGGYDLEIGHF